jgi:hypothetical protein
MREQMMEEQLFLWLVVAAEAADHVSHPATVVAIGDYPTALVHDLHPLPSLLDHLAGVPNLWNGIGVATG